MSGPTIMLTLGEYQFSINTAAYQELRRVTEWRWPTQDRFMQLAAMQYVGPGGDTMTMPGVIYPHFRGGLGQLEAMRAQAGQGVPLTLIDGQGNVLGRWAITAVEERQTVFFENGAPLAQEFTLQLRKFDELGASAIFDAASIISTASAAAQSLTLVDSAVSLAGTTASQYTGFMATLTGVASDIAGISASLAGQAADVLAPINRAVNTATSLRNAANDATKLMGSVPNLLSARGGMGRLLEGANTAVMNASAASGSLKRVTNDLQTLGTISSSAIHVVNQSLATVNRFTAATAQTQASTSNLLNRLFG